MCGITGLLEFRRGSVSADLVAAMTATLAHRGPDDRGCFIEGPVGLGHTRLSIIDLSAAGHQPMRSADGRWTLVFNGEIYNFRDLRDELEAAGSTFRGHSDTEVLLAAWSHWGPAMLGRLNGMFAFAIWDGHTKTLSLARDRFGIKPLYLAHTRTGGLVFGSEIKAILASGFVDRHIDPAALHEHLYYGNSLETRTLFAGIETLAPGHVLHVSEAGIRREAFWSLDSVPVLDLEPADAVTAVRDALARAVTRQMVSDVPIGVFLSGGIDSSCITAFASRHAEGRLQTFSVGFDFDRGVNELPKAKQVAEHFGTDHQELHLEGGRLPDVLAALIRCHDQPFSDAANIPLYLLCRELGGSPKVILQGDGGDEIFAGYRRYALLARAGVWRTMGVLGRLANGLTPRNQAFFRRARMVRALTERDAGLRMARLLTLETPEESPVRLLAPAWRQRVAAHDPFSAYRACNQALAALDPVQRMLYTDTRIILPNTFLEKVDKSTMAHGIEVRVPLLDQDLTDLAMGLPSRVKVKGSEKKYILRAALRGILPDAILDGPKTGFGVPTDYWLRGPLAGFMREVLTAAPADLFDKGALERTMETHIAGGRNHGFLLLKAVNLALWAEAYDLETSL